MKVTIDRENCISCAVCWEECPGVFEQNDEDSWSQIVEQYQNGSDPAKGDIPEKMEDCARSAADGCPVEIIHIQS